MLNQITNRSRRRPVAGKVGQASRLLRERTSARIPGGGAAGGRRDACPTLKVGGYRPNQVIL